MPVALLFPALFSVALCTTSCTLYLPGNMLRNPTLLLPLSVQQLYPAPLPLSAHSTLAGMGETSCLTRAIFLGLSHCKRRTMIHQVGPQQRCQHEMSPHAEDAGRAAHTAGCGHHMFLSWFLFSQAPRCKLSNIIAATGSPRLLRGWLGD